MTHATDLIATLNLRPHPEGGHFIETFRSTDEVAAHGGCRAASTAIYFLLRAGEVSRWHRVRSDEVWHWYEGAPLRLWMCRALGEPIQEICVGPVDGAAQRPQAVVPAGWWQAAAPVGEFALVGCTVAPGFDFADFTLIDPTSADAEWFRTRADPRLVDGT